jgi:hypothetical protein
VIERPSACRFTRAAAHPAYQAMLEIGGAESHEIRDGDMARLSRLKYP